MLSVPAPSRLVCGLAVATAATIACTAATTSDAPAVSIVDITQVPDTSTGWHFVATVMDANTQQPLAGAQVWVTDLRGRSGALPCAPALTGSDGVATNNCPRSGELQVEVRRIGYREADLPFLAEPGHRYDVRVRLQTRDLPDTITVRVGGQEPLRK